MEEVNVLDVLFSSDDDNEIDCFESNRTYSSGSISSSDSEDACGHRRNHIPDFINKYSEKEFRRHFRFNKNTFQYMLSIVSGPYERMFKRTHGGGKSQTSAKDCLLLTLWYLANTESFREVADRFDIDRSTACILIHRMVKIICGLASQFICWPNIEQMAESELFFRRKGMPYIIGAIDGTTMQIVRPSENQQDYYSGRKKYHCIVMQAVVNHRLEFIDIFVGEPGSQHDARVFAKSNLYTTITSNPELMHGYSILGDSAYPELDWVITPFRDNGHLTDEQLIFNRMHASSRILVENAFGQLKKRFRRIRFFENLKLNFIKHACIAAVVFHNMCMSQNEEINFDDSGYEDSENEEIIDEDFFIELGIQQANRTNRVYEHLSRETFSA